MATVVGGANIGLALDPRELQAAQQALTNIGQGFPGAELNTSLAQPIVTPADLQVYLLPGGGTNVLNASNDVVIFSATPSPTPATTISVTGQNDLIIGNQGHDKINFTNGSGSVFAGNGKDVVNIQGANLFIQFGTGNDTVNMTGGAATINHLRNPCLLYTSPSPRDLSTSRMPSSA